MSDAMAGRVRGDRVPRGGVLLIGAICNGAFAALAMWLAGRALGLAAFEALAQLWTIWGLTAIGFVFAFQQWEVTRNRDLAPSRRRPVPGGVKVALVAASAAMLVIATVFRIRIFGSPSLVWPLAAATLPVGTAITGLGYATFARSKRLRDLAMVMASENGLRLLLTGGLALVGAPTTWFATTIPVGFLVSLLPLSVTGIDERAGPVHRSGSAGQIPQLTMVGFSATFLVFGGPLLLGASGGQATVVSTLFLVLIIPRVPFLLVNAFVPVLIVQAGEAVADGRADRIRHWVVLLAAAGTGVAVLGAVVGYFVADPVAAALFGAGGQLDPLVYSLLGAAVGFTLAASLTNPLLLAVGLIRVVTVSWAVVVLSGAALTVVGAIADPLALTVWMVACAAGVVLVHLAASMAAGMEARR